MPAQGHGAWGCFNVLGPKRLEELSGIKGIFDGVVNGIREHLIDLTQMRCLDEDVANSFVPRAKWLNVVAKVFANFIDVEIVGCN